MSCLFCLCRKRKSHPFCHHFRPCHEGYLFGGNRPFNMFHSLFTEEFPYFISGVLSDRFMLTTHFPRNDIPTGFRQIVPSFHEAISARFAEGELCPMCPKPIKRCREWSSELARKVIRLVAEILHMVNILSIYISRI